MSLVDDEIKLINRARENDQKAFSELLERYRKSVYYLILKIVKNPEEAEDLTFITFDKAFRNLDKYTPSHKFSTWIFKIASNTSIDFLRKNSLETLGIASGGEVEPGEVLLDNKVKNPDLDPEELIIKKQRLAFIQQVVKHLNENFEEVIRLRFFEEYSYEEIAKELNLPLGTVKVQIHRAKKLLQSILKDNTDNF